MNIGRYFRDIRFNPKASFVLDDTLFLGSNIGVMKLGAFSGTSVRWVDLEGSVPSLSMLMVIFFCIVLLLVVIVLEYFRRKHGKRKVLKMHLEDISDRLESLSAISRFTNEADDGEICKLKGLLGEIDLNDTQAPDRIRSLSGIIMKKNRDFALRLSKCLDRQLSVIERYEAFDKVRLVEESHTVQATDNLEQIVAQVEKNENWIQTMNGLEERMTRYRSEMEETVCIEGVNGRFLSEMQTLENNIRAKGLSELKEDIRRMDESYSFIFTDDALELVESYIACNLSKLRELDADKVTDALRVELEHVRTEMNSLDRVKLLKRLYPIDCHASQLFLKARIAEWMEEYVSIRSRVEKENEERINRKFGTQLAMEIADSTLLLTQRIEKHVSVFYESMLNTDRDILNELELANPTNQTAKVLTLLIANPKIKRLYIPGMLGLYGNMNPVISRLVNNKLKVRCDLLKSYVEHHPTSMMFYVLHLID